MLIARTGKQFLMMIEIITDSRKNSFRNVIKSNGRKIELRSCNRYEYIYQIIDKEGSDKHKRHLFKPLEPINEIE